MTDVAHKKILIVTKNFPPSICGVGDHSYELLRTLKKNDLFPIIFTEKKEGLQAFIILKKLQGVVLSDVWGTLNLYFTIKNACKKYSIDTILWQYVPYSFAKKGLPFYLPICMLLLRVSGIKQTTYFHEIAIRRKKRGLKKYIWSSMQRLVAWFVCMISQKRITNTIFHQQYLYPFKSHLIPVGANILNGIESAANNKENETLRIFCFTSRITLTMLEAINATYRDKGITFRLEIAGRSTNVEKLQLDKWLHSTSLSQHAILHGVLEQGLLSKLMQSSDMIIHAEPEDISGEGGVSSKNGTVIAAMAMAKPIISTVGDLTDQSLFINGQNILLAKYSDKNSWIEALTRLYDPNFRFLMGQYAYQTWKKEFAWEVISIKIASVLYG